MSGLPVPAEIPVVKTDRPKATFQIPEASRLYPTDPKSVTVTTLLVSQENDAMKVAMATGNNVIHEMAKRSLWAVNGRPLNWAEDEPQKVFESCSPKVRELLVAAYQKLNENDNKSREDFLGSMKIEM